ncbi:MAG: Wzz/FepE/Etk N-terminal domain-containing protein [Desulfotomaculaceae bacterium]
MGDEIDLKDYVAVIWRWKVFIVLASIIMTFLVGWPSLSQKKIYEAKAVLLLKGQNNSQIPGMVPAGLFGIQLNGSNSFLSIISSRAVAEIVLDDLNLTKRIKGWALSGISRQDQITAVQAMPKISKGELIEIKIINNDPVLAADIANDYAAAAEKYWRKMNFTEARKKRAYLESQIPRVAADLKSSEQKIKKFSLLAPDNLSALGVEARRLRMEYDILVSTYSMLKSEFELAKLEEAKEIDAFSVIDRADVPNKPIPKRRIFSFIAGFSIGLFGSMFLAFFLDYLIEAFK